MENEQIEQISFFYKGNGMGYHFEENDSFLDELEKYILETQKVVDKEGTKFLFDQLDELHPRINGKGPQNDEDKSLYLIWAMNIYYLTKKGFLKNDRNKHL